jgi:hypothetical protein
MDGDVDYKSLARRQAFQSSSLPQTRNVILQESFDPHEVTY